jgi:hypothetical protein
VGFRKGPLLANFHKNTLRALAELLGSVGLGHPGELKPWHLHIRHQSGAALRGDDFYPRVAPAALLKGELSDELRREWQRAQAASFEPAIAHEEASTEAGALTISDKSEYRLIVDGAP